MLFAWLTALLLALREDVRQWRDEIVYVVIIETFSDGEKSGSGIGMQLSICLIASQVPLPG